MSYAITAAAAVIILGFIVSTSACGKHQCELSEQEMAALRNYRVEYSYWSFKPIAGRNAETISLQDARR